MVASLEVVKAMLEILFLQPFPYWDKYTIVCHQVHIVTFRVPTLRSYIFPIFIFIVVSLIVYKKYGIPKNLVFFMKQVLIRCSFLTNEEIKAEELDLQ